MRKVLKQCILPVLLTLFVTAAFGQDNEAATPSTPKWISEKGYWVIENNINTPDTSVVHFYNNNNVLLYSEKVQGITLNLKKRKPLMALKKALEESVLAWQMFHRTNKTPQLVSILKL